jgi:hypothetical protein
MEQRPLEPDTEKRVRSMLEDGEKILWSSPVSPPAYARLVIQNLVALGYAVGMLWLILTLSMGRTWALTYGYAAYYGVVATVPVLGFGFLAMAVSRRSLGAAYVLTDRRALVLTPSLFGRYATRSVPASNLSRAAVVVRPDGTGNVLLGAILAPASARKGTYVRELVGFFGVDDARALHARVLEAARAVPQVDPQVEPQRSTPVQLIVPVILWLMAIAFFLPGVSVLVKASQSSSWPRAAGFVKDSRVIVVHGGKSDRLKPSIFYVYGVDGRTHTGSVLAFGDDLGEHRSANDAVSRYPRGASILVHYNPAQPDESVLESGIMPTAFLMPAAGVFIALLGSGVLFFARMNNWPREQAGVESRFLIS